MSRVHVQIELEALAEIVAELKGALEPMVPYKIDPLVFCREAHKVKDKHIERALELLPTGFVDDRVD